MARRNDKELRRLYRTAVAAADGSTDDIEWKKLLKFVEEKEREDPWVRNRVFMTERLGSFFISSVRKSGRPIPIDLMEKVAKLILLFERPLLASPVLEAMVENCSDPVDALEDAIRMAEVSMNVEYTRLTADESEEAIVGRLVEYSDGVGEQVEKSDARTFVKGMFDKAHELQSAGMKCEELGPYASRHFVERLRSRGLSIRKLSWYRDSIIFCLQRHPDPYLAAVTIVQMASRDPDPTQGLANLVLSARRST